MTPPSGWTLVRQTANGTTMTQSVYTHVVGAGEPASQTWTLLQGAERGGRDHRLRRSAQRVARRRLGRPGERVVDRRDGAVDHHHGGGHAARRLLRHRQRQLVHAPGRDDRAGRLASLGTYKVTLEGADVSRSAQARPGPRATAANGAANVGQLVALAP